MVVSWDGCLVDILYTQQAKASQNARVSGRTDALACQLHYARHYHDKREHQRSAKANAGTGATIHRSHTTLAKARFLDSRVHTQIQQRSPIPCYSHATQETTRAQSPVGIVCAHVGYGRPYLAQGSCMQYNRRKLTQCACETTVTKEKE